MANRASKPRLKRLLASSLNVNVKCQLEFYAHWQKASINCFNQICTCFVLGCLLLAWRILAVRGRGPKNRGSGSSSRRI
jgi:hypothetical protein